MVLAWHGRVRPHHEKLGHGQSRRFTLFLTRHFAHRPGPPYSCYVRYSPLLVASSLGMTLYRSHSWLICPLEPELPEIRSRLLCIGVKSTTRSLFPLSAASTTLDTSVNCPAQLPNAGSSAPCYVPLLATNVYSHNSLAATATESFSPPQPAGL